MMYIQHLDCCGIKELAGVSQTGTPEALMRDFCSQYYPTRDVKANSIYGTNSFNCAFILFSEAGQPASKYDYATKFAAFVTENKLGDVTEIEGGKNPNSGNQVRPFMWKINKKAVIRWADSNCTWRAEVKGVDMSAPKSNSRATAASANPPIEG